MKRIAIVTAPRTGSNMLIKSLIAADQRVNVLPEHFPEHEITDHNLVKIFICHRHDPRFSDIMSKYFVVHLWRENLQNQIDGWFKSCKTGTWEDTSPGSGPFFPRPTHPREVVEFARLFFGTHLDVDHTLSFEQLLEDTNREVNIILKKAGWLDE